MLLGIGFIWRQLSKSRKCVTFEDYYSVHFDAFFRKSQNKPRYTGVIFVQTSRKYLTFRYHNSVKLMYLGRYTIVVVVPCTNSWRKTLILNAKTPKFAPKRVTQIMTNFWRKTLILNAKTLKFFPAGMAQIMTKFWRTTLILNA